MEGETKWEEEGEADRCRKKENHASGCPRAEEQHCPGRRDDANRKMLLWVMMPGAGNLSGPLCNAVRPSVR